MLPFVDTHVHFWDHSVPGLRWPWLAPDFEHPRVRSLHEYDAPRWAAPELRAEAAGTGLAKVVHVQATERLDDPVEETAWLEAMAASEGWPDAIVGDCPLADPAAVDVIRRHAEHPRFRGVRDLGVGHHLAEPAVAEACRQVGEVGACVEVVVPWTHHRGLADLARRCPGTVFVLGHAGSPWERTADYFADWRRGLDQVAAVDNVVCKISSLAGGADPRWTVDSIRPWARACIDAFGPGRCMFGSNWPVDRPYGTYGGVVAAYRAVIDDLDRGDQARLLAGTAEAVYRL